MSSISALMSGSSTGSSNQETDRMNELTMSDFISMMVAELENQDPMDPMSNTEILAQIGQIRQITSNDKLTASIESLTLSQSLTTASSLIGKTIQGVNTLGNSVSGVVDKVKIENNTPKLYVGSSIIEVANVTAISGDSGNILTDLFK